MRPSTLVGVLMGGVLALMGGVALAARRQKVAPGAEPPYFVYTVRPGDTLSALAKTFFGDAEQWPLLFAAMPTLPNDAQKALPVGAVIHVSCTWVSVQPGDNLAKIAQRTLGDGTRWRRIAEANKKALPDPNKLAVGQRLAVPVVPSPTPSVSIGEDLDLLDAELVGCG